MMAEMTYRQTGDYQIPEIGINQQKEPLGKWGRMRRTYLQENRPMLYSDLVLSEKLYPHLDIINPSDIVAGRIREVLDDRDGFARGSDFTNVFYASDLSENFINMIDNIFKDEEKKVKFLNFDLERELGQ